MWQWIKRRFWTPIYDAANKWQADDGLTQAAAVAYYAAFSFFPWLLLSISVLGFVMRFSSDAQSARQEFLALLSKNASPALAEHVNGVLSQISDRASLSGPLALATLLIAAIGVFAQIEHAFDVIWRTTESPWHGVTGAILNALYYRLRAFLMLIGAGLLMIAAFVAGIASASFRSAASQLPVGGWFWGSLETVVGVALFTLFFGIVYKTLPKPAIAWRDALRGGVLAAVLWEITRRGLSYFLIGESYTAYGVVGSLIAVMLWIYIAAMILFLGAEYVQVLGHHRDEHQRQLFS